MVHWTFYPVMGTLIAGFLVFSYYYLRWTRAMDRMNEDHWEYLKSPGRMIEGVNYFTAEIFKAHLVVGASRFPVEEEDS